MAKPPPKCAKCKQPINDAVVMAMGKAWHKDHFVCAHCNKNLRDLKFMQEGGKPYCEADWITLFQNANAAICAQCNQPITDSVVNALGKTWHKDHFVCAYCKKPFKELKFMVQDGKPYCDEDYKKLFQSSQGTGNQASGSSGNQASGSSGNQASGSSGNQVSGSSPICAQCNQPITGAVMTAMGKNWHQEHFVCAHCKKPLLQSVFHTNDGKPYCEADYGALFGKKCSACGQIIKDGVLTALDKPWHQKCFTCNKCKKPINAQQGFKEMGGLPYCVTCV